MPSVPEGVLTLTSPLFCELVTKRKAPREASTATLPLPLFGSYTNLSSRTFEPGPTVILLLSRKRRSACPLLPVRIDSLAWTLLPADSVPPTLPEASGFTELAVPILVWAFATVEAIAKSTISGSAEMESRPNVLMFVLMALLPKKLTKR